MAQEFLALTKAGRMNNFWYNLLAWVKRGLLLLGGSKKNTFSCFGGDLGVWRCFCPRKILLQLIFVLFKPTFEANAYLGFNFPSYHADFLEFLP